MRLGQVYMGQVYMGQVCTCMYWLGVHAGQYAAGHCAYVQY